MYVFYITITESLRHAIHQNLSSLVKSILEVWLHIFQGFPGKSILDVKTDSTGKPHGSVFIVGQPGKSGI